MYIHIVKILVLKNSFALTFFMLALFFISNNGISQQVTLNIFAKSANDLKLINKTHFKKHHKTVKGAISEADSVSTFFAKEGYIYNFYDLKINDTIVTCNFTLGKRIEKIRIQHKSKELSKKLLQKISKKYDSTFFEIKTVEIEKVMKVIVNYYENLGNSFTTASLKNIYTVNHKLYATLNLTINSERTIDKIVIRGYDNFPKKFLENHLGLALKSTFNSETLQNTEQLLNTLPFVSQVKKPEMLFTKDSTILYIYLKKKNNNLFDGILGFSNTKNNKSIKLNGYLNLELNNIFNKGTSFNLNWISNADNNKSLNIGLYIPYIKKSKFSITGNFNLLKQDSSYLNNSQFISLNYHLKKANTIGIGYLSEKSDINTLVNNTLFQPFQKQFLGLMYSFNIDNNNTVTNPLGFEIHYYAGKRNSKNININQSILQLNAFYSYIISLKSSIQLKNSNKLLFSSNELENEFYRIGGINSIRGFNEESILTSQYSTTNLEYHFNLTNFSYLYSITDISLIKDKNANTFSSLYGIGIGYYTKTDKSIINLSYAIGKNNKSPFILNNSRFHIKISYPF